MKSVYRQENKLVYEVVKSFLLKHFKEPALGNTFTPELTAALYKKFKASDAKDLELFRKELRRAFTDFYEPIGTVVVLFKGFKEIALRIRAYDRIKASLEADLLQELTLIIFDHDESLHREEGRTDLIIIDKDLYQAIATFIKHKGSHLDGKELTKKAIKLALSLSEKDAVIIMNNRIVIRIFQVMDKLKGSEQRFNGLPLKELKTLENKHFSDQKALQKFFDEVVKSACKTDLNYHVITNFFFMDKRIPIVQNHLHEHLQRKMNEEPFVIEGFANYIFREMFDYTHKQFSILLLEQYVEGEAEAFIRFYNADTHVESNGTRVKAPQIIDKENTVWNFVNIKSLHNKKRLEEERIKSTHEKIKQSLSQRPQLQETIEKNLIKIREYTMQYKTTIMSLEQNEFEIERISAQLSELALKDQKDDSIQKRITQTKAMRKEQQQELNQNIELRNSIPKQKKALESQNTVAQQKVGLLNKQAGDFKKTFDRQREAFKLFLVKYNLMLNALSNTLSKKKDTI
jgi:hypothetical protein